MKILTVVGARPQFVKASAVSLMLRTEGIDEVLVHTGQHFDDAMSGVFFRQLGLGEPRYNLGVSGGTHGQMTGRMLERAERVIADENPSAVLVYGDTNSTLAGALAAVKLKIPVLHVEAGLRSGRRDMPEEINRTLTDHAATVLLCATHTAVDNLRREGFDQILNDGAFVEAPVAVDPTRPCVANVGDVMLDVLMRYRNLDAGDDDVLERLHVRPGEYGLLTLHRAENTASVGAVRSILDAVSRIDGLPVVFAAHPRTEQMLREAGFGETTGALRVIKPLPYVDFLRLQAHARVILTDSGGVQKEAYFLGIRCITLRNETEWPETTRNGWNVVAGAHPRDLQTLIERPLPPQDDLYETFGGGRAAARIRDVLRATLH